MTTTAAAYGASSATAPLEPLTIERRAVGPHDVRIDIHFCGICHSDIHTVRGDWRPQQYPLVPGHEIVGTVAEVGAEVTGFQPGDQVGVGCMVNSCGECEHCRAGEEQFCVPGAVFTYGSPDKDGTLTQGGYATGIVVTEGFVVRIPEGLALDAAAPLLCAGITTYSPLKRWGAGPGKRVGVIGLGGLGHMAVKIAKAMGAEVVVLSQSLSKKDDGLRLGASDYRATSDKTTFKELAASLDLIINTVSATLPMDRYLGLLKIDGALVNVGLPSEPMAVNAFSLTHARRSLSGSLIGGIRETQEMLDFCAEHGITADIELIDAAQINEAWERVLNSDVRYRFVIDTATLDAAD
ncbi:MAG: NAD(P)-dependent alcohol dehydrogenase [Solirubrobacteraceae bacterium]|nr:NAD(P)-dependent alcohol dehydrogenase [Solirubrobacteraceae bacterium]